VLPWHNEKSNCLADFAAPKRLHPWLQLVHSDIEMTSRSSNILFLGGAGGN
jgi:hypothetical protein